ncbi:MAG: hypothetical protein IKF78_10465 [Atopobiaceae bacterium]|nr:hypothetical protein [Atopobiaceae bacterium]
MIIEYLTAILKGLKKYYVENRLLGTICFLHFAISTILSSLFFCPIMEHVGFENTAYKWIFSGATMEHDYFAKLSCAVCSYILAAIFIYVLWKRAFNMAAMWKFRSDRRPYIVSFVVLALVGVIVLLGLYPSIITIPPDTTYNYVYAREFMPMYWHGFFTNVVHCACMIVFPHPLSMAIVPYLIGFFGLCHIVYKAAIEHCRRGLLWASIFAMFLLLMPETIQVLMYAGRNYQYALLSVYTLSLFLIDYMDRVKLTWTKFLGRTALVCFMACWRTEGIVYLAVYPFILYSIYYSNINILSKKTMLKGLTILLGIFFLFTLLDKYGSEKYQGLDYMIINVPGPLAAVWTNNPDTDYRGYQEDLEALNRVTPIDYIMKYGEMGTQNFNWDQLRISRQSNAGNNGAGFVNAAYSILLHNYNIFIKYQFNNFAISNGLAPLFQLKNCPGEEWKPSEKVNNFRKNVLRYYQVGQNDIANNYDIVVINPSIDKKLSQIVTKFTTILYKNGMKYSAYVKIALTLFTFVIVIESFISKRWPYFWIGAAILIVLLIVILFSPAVRQNYYNSSFYNQYYFIFCYLFQLKVERDNKKQVTIKAFDAIE